MTLICKYIFANTKEITRRKTHLKIHSKAFSQKSDPLQYAAVQYDLLFIYEQTNLNSASRVSVFMAAETITLDFMLIFSKTMHAQFKLFFGLSRLRVHCVLFKFFFLLHRLIRTMYSHPFLLCLV